MVMIASNGYVLFMDKKHQRIDELDAREREDEFREAITSADATGMIASEEFVIETETILPTLPRS